MSENRPSVVFVTDGRGNKIFNKNGLALVQNTADQTLMYVQPVERSTNSLPMQPIKELNLSSDSSSSTQPKSQSPFIMQPQQHRGIVEQSAISNPGDRDLENDTDNNDATSDKANWSHDAIITLIAKYKNYLVSFQINTKGHTEIWKKISSHLHTCGHKYTYKQCENKFKNLKKRYHAKIDNMKSKQTGAPPYRFNYFDIFHEIFGQKPNVEPVALASSTRGSASLNILDAVSEEAILQDDNDENEAFTKEKGEGERRAERTPGNTKKRKPEFEKALDEMKKVKDEKTKQQDLRQQKLLAAHKRQTDRIVQSIEKLIDKF